MNQEHRRDEFFQLMNVLARPQLDANSAERLQSIVGEAQWKPLSLPHLHHEVLPLARANAEAAGVEFGRLFQPTGGQPLPSSAAHCAQAYFARRRRIDELAAIFAAVGIRRAALIKGAAVASHMPSPALRLMCDLDVLLSSGDLPLARAALVEAGWRPVSRDHATLRHASGWTVDLQIPASSLGEAMLETATPAQNHFLLPRPALLQALLAIHSFQGHGERVWRDTADWRALAAAPNWSADDFESALMLAETSGHAASIRAFQCFVGKLDGVDASATKTREVADRVQLLLLTARETTGEATLHLARQVRRPLLGMFAGLAGNLRRPALPVEGSPAVRGALRGLYDVPRGRRIRLACGLVASAMVSAESRRLLGLALMQQKLAAPSLFSSPGGVAHVSGSR